ncbi:ATP-binding cassette domain-containing protein [Streptomyces cyaneofuscatus]|uniref:ATP-binding cassette domain-containing protein n=1 Tax=Streptomyces cyaneofuscatus TaxID=66883 RepID=UPI0036609D5D
MTGPTGSGKTTLAKLLTGLYTPDSSTVRYDGPDEKAIARSVEHLGLTGWTESLDDGLHTVPGRGAVGSPPVNSS